MLKNLQKVFEILNGLEEERKDEEVFSARVPSIGENRRKMAGRNEEFGSVRAGI